MTTYDNGPALTGWKVERRPCVFCGTPLCGCPHEPEMRAISPAEQAEWNDR